MFIALVVACSAPPNSSSDGSGALEAACWLESQRSEGFAFGDDGELADHPRRIDTWTWDEHGNEVEHIYEQDMGDDGSVDYTTESRTTYTYDERDNILRVVYSDDDDAWWSSISWTYDERDNPLTQDEDRDGDGSFGGMYDERTAWTWDEHDNMLTESSLDEDGRVEWTWRWDYIYDASGNALVITGYGPDGDLDTKYTHTYDERGNVLTTEVIDDTDDDSEDAGWEPGRIDEIHYWTYDAEDRVVSEDVDRHGNGDVDQHESWTYDARGNVLTHDGEIDGRGWSESWSYDERGNVLTHDSKHETDFGDVIQNERWTYDSHDNVVVYRYSGTWNGSTAYEYSYDDYGNVVTRSDDTNADGSAEKRHTLTWACGERG